MPEPDDTAEVEFSHGTNNDRCFPCGKGQDWPDEYDNEHDLCQGDPCACPCRAPLDANERYALRAMLEAVRS